MRNGERTVLVDVGHEHHPFYRFESCKVVKGEFLRGKTSRSRYLDADEKEL